MPAISWHDANFKWCIYIYLSSHFPATIKVIKIDDLVRISDERQESPGTTGMLIHGIIFWRGRGKWVLKISCKQFCSKQGEKWGEKLRTFSMLWCSVHLVKFYAPLFSIVILAPLDNYPFWSPITHHESVKVETDSFVSIRSPSVLMVRHRKRNSLSWQSVEWDKVKYCTLAVDWNISLSSS